MNLFNLWPGHWGLKGKMRERAKIEYDFNLPKDARIRAEKLMELDFKGKELKQEKLKLELEYGDMTEREYEEQWNKLTFSGKELAEKMLILRLCHKEITQRQFDEEKIKLAHKKDSKEFQTAENEMLLEYDEITAIEFAKRKATLDDEPWVHGELHGDPEEGFYFEMDWNPLFLEYLTTLGFSGSSDEDVVDQWITRLYTNEFMLGEWENLRSEADTGVTINTTKRDDGKTEHT